MFKGCDYMKKVLIGILSIYYLFIFILCLESLISSGSGRNFGTLWLVPAFAAVLVHIVFFFKKSQSFKFGITIAICDVLFFISPCLIFGFSIMADIYAVIMWIVPLICSVILGIFIIEEKKQTDEKQ